MTNNNRNPIRVLIRCARKRQGLSQLELALLADVSLNTVSLAERSGRMSPRTAERIAAALGLAPEQLTAERAQPEEG